MSTEWNQTSFKRPVTQTNKCCCLEVNKDVKNFLKLPFLPPGLSDNLLFLGFFISFQQHHKKSISLDKLLSVLLFFCRKVISFLVLEPSSWEMVGSGQDVFAELDHVDLDPGSPLGLSILAVRTGSVGNTEHLFCHGSESICMKMHNELKEELLKSKAFLVALWRNVIFHKRRWHSRA